MTNHKTFQKPPLSIDQQLDLLSSRGLIINDRQTAQHYLKFVSYYRFCGYGIGFENVASKSDSQKHYIAGTTFDHILDRYLFDRKLRLLTIDAIECIEIAIRTVIINELALLHGAHWYLDRKLFIKSFKHAALIETIEKETQHTAQVGSVKSKKQENFIRHYFDKYSHPKLPAVWMLGEILPLGTWSMIFANLINRDHQKVICKHFNINHLVMGSWLHSLTYLRNLCAHHSKLWNRSFTLKPLIANNYHEQLKNNSRFSAQAAILKIFLDIISPHSRWGERLYELSKEHPNISPKHMGFAEHWYDDPFWRVVKSK